MAIGGHGVADVGAVVSRRAIRAHSRARPSTIRVPV